ncbi:MAG: large subunit ribosomal protein L5 [Puniceicoccaceae bacterium 5H]|nr:MAG: large subunit ribosomal protein L5 [Puniceicoccaceae bacterium 5H]
MPKPFLQEHFEKVVAPELQKDFNLENVHLIPRVSKIVLNTGFNATLDKGQIEETVRDLSSIAGQKAVVTKARKSISNFKLREGMPIGAKVTLRGAAMWHFLYKTLAVALPAIRDFRGVNEKFDGAGNYTLGISDITIFPEISQDGSKRQMGLDICIVTTAESDDLGRELLRKLGMPFRKRTTSQEPAAANA